MTNDRINNNYYWFLITLYDEDEKADALIVDSFKNPGEVIYENDKFVCRDYERKFRSYIECTLEDEANGKEFYDISKVVLLKEKRW